MKNITYLVMGTVFTVVGTFLIGYIFFYEKNDVINNYVPSAPQSTYPANNSPNTKQSTSNIKVQSVSDVNQSQPQQNQLPIPKTFSVYEEFANSESIRYIDVSIGAGAEAVTGDSVAMLYQGWLTNGELFDQNRINEQNQIEPFVFQLGANQVIQGWDQGIIGMKEGGKRRLIIPSRFGYGPDGQGPIPPNAMLIFDVELIKVQRP